VNRLRREIIWEKSYASNPSYAFVSRTIFSLMMMIMMMIIIIIIILIQFLDDDDYDDDNNNNNINSVPC